MTTNFIDPQMFGSTSASVQLDTHAFPSSAQLILKLLRKLQHGSVTISFPDGQAASFGHGPCNSHLHIRDWNVFQTVLKSGDIGFAESYIAGLWSASNLPALLELLSRNRRELEELIYGSWWGSLLYRIKHLLNRNSRAGSKKNIHAHYDIGNDFYQLWLDPSMTYSSAIFSGSKSATLQEAQSAKYARIISELQLQANSRVLEIGCGWGGFAEMAASEASAHVTGLTLSKEQLRYAEKRLQDAGLITQTELKIQDYRDAQGEYDAIASIEMFEAVGEAYWPSYFECIARNLKSQGRACIQTIVIADELFERYRKGTDFIQQYIFPGGMLPSISVFKHYANMHGLEVCNTLTFGTHYAKTLQEWRSAFLSKLQEVRRQGFDEEFIRTWEFYLAYCEAGFLAGSINVAQFTLVKR